jgi:hypothetical protein
LLQEQGATIIAAQPIINRGFEKAPGIFNLATRNSALGGLPGNHIFREAQIGRDFF